MGAALLSKPRIGHGQRFRVVDDAHGGRCQGWARHRRSPIERIGADGVEYFMHPEAKPIIADGEVVGT